MRQPENYPNRKEGDIVKLTAEEMAALGRLRDLDSTMEGCRIYNAPPDEAVAHMNFDHEILARAVLREYREDDGEAADEAFVRSLGTPIRDDDECIIVVLESPIVTMALIWSYETYASKIMNIKPGLSLRFDSSRHKPQEHVFSKSGVSMTRGDVRRLGEVLGVPVKEKV